MKKRQQTKSYLVWLLIVYLASRLVISGYLSVQLDPEPTFPLPCQLAGGPQESLGDGPGNKIFIF
ncbi:MAG: hypothetical protein KF832_19055 [Caldilineaceae bacterium]|nr:hypothetical protein [Caldilineaceae bacterium]